MQSYYEFCRQSVQINDPDRYLVSLMVPQRDALWALFAFDFELAKTRLVVSEPALGMIRLKWWMDEIAKIFKGEAHAAGEVLDALAEVIAEYGLPQAPFDALIEARGLEISGDTPDGVDGALAFLDMVHVPLLELMVRISGGDPATEPVAAVAMNYGVIEVLRRADEKSLVGQNRDVFEAAFTRGVQAECKALRVVQALSEIWFGHLRAGRKGRPPAFLALRLWAFSLFI